MSTLRKLRQFTEGDLRGAQHDAKKQQEKFIKYQSSIKPDSQILEALEKSSDAAMANVYAINEAINGDAEAIKKAIAAGENAIAASKKAKNTKDYIGAQKIFVSHYHYFIELAKNVYQSFTTLNNDFSNSVSIFNFLNNLYFFNKAVSDLIVKGDMDNWSLDKRDLLIEMIYKDPQVSCLKLPYKEAAKMYLNNLSDLLGNSRQMILAEEQEQIMDKLPQTSQYLQLQQDDKEWNYDERLKHLAQSCADRGLALGYFSALGLEEKSFFSFLHSNSTIDSNTMEKQVDEYLVRFYSLNLKNAFNEIKIPAEDLLLSDDIQALNKTLIKIVDPSKAKGITPEQLYKTAQSTIMAYFRQYKEFKPYMCKMLQTIWNFEGIKLADKKTTAIKTETITSELISPRTPLTPLTISSLSALSIDTTTSVSALSPSPYTGDTITSPLSSLSLLSQKRSNFPSSPTSPLNPRTIENNSSSKTPTSPTSPFGKEEEHNDSIKDLPSKK